MFKIVSEYIVCYCVVVFGGDCELGLCQGWVVLDVLVVQKDLFEQGLGFCQVFVCSVEDGLGNFVWGIGQLCGEIFGVQCVVMKQQVVYVQSFDQCCRRLWQVLVRWISEGWLGMLWVSCWIDWFILNSRVCWLFLWIRFWVQKNEVQCVLWVIGLILCRLVLGQSIRLLVGSFICCRVQVFWIISLLLLQFFGLLKKRVEDRLVWICLWLLWMLCMVLLMWKLNEFLLVQQLNSGGKILSGRVVDMNRGWFYRCCSMVLLIFWVSGWFCGSCRLCLVLVDWQLVVVLLLVYFVCFRVVWIWEIFLVVKMVGICSNMVLFMKVK